MTHFSSHAGTGIPKKDVAGAAETHTAGAQQMPLLGNRPFCSKLSAGGYLQLHSKVLALPSLL